MTFAIKVLDNIDNIANRGTEGLSWHQVLRGNYYYNLGDHGGVIVYVNYIKTE